MRIYKYPLGNNRITKIEMPGSSKILKVDSQFDEPFLWVLVNNYSEPEIRTFVTFNTDEEILDNRTDFYIGAYMTHGGNYVHHVFEFK